MILPDALALLLGLRPAAEPPPPRLAVLPVVDQIRADHRDRFTPVRSNQRPR